MLLQHFVLDFEYIFFQFQLSCYNFLLEIYSIFPFKYVATTFCWKFTVSLLSNMLLQLLVFNLQYIFPFQYVTATFFFKFTTSFKYVAFTFCCKFTVSFLSSMLLLLFALNLLHICFQVH